MDAKTVIFTHTPNLNHRDTQCTEIKTSRTALDVAKEIAKVAVSHKFKVTCVTQGFRAEYDGVPVLKRETGEFFKSINVMYYGNNPVEIVEYAIVSEKNGMVVLSDYIGLAGRAWTGDARSLLQITFKSLESK